MMTVQHCSLKFDFMRLHNRAWNQKLIRKPRSMNEHELQEKTKRLFKALVVNLLKKKGLLFTEEDCGEQLHIKVEELSVWLDEVASKQIETLPTKINRPTQENPTIYVSFRQGQISCASQQLQMLEHDLSLYEALAHNVPSELAVKSPFGKTTPRRARRNRNRS